MRRLFADAFYWIALLHAGDQWHRKSSRMIGTLPKKVFAFCFRK